MRSQNKTKAPRRRSGRVVLEALESRRMFSFGVDSYFGANGVSSVTFTANERISANGMAGLPDGRIYVVASTNSKPALARLTFDGQLDPTFGTGGEVITSGLSSRFQVNSMALQSDGKPLIVGGDNDFTLLRFNPDGSPDSTFGTSGIVHTAFGPQLGHSNGGSAGGSLFQTDQKIITFGNSDNGNHTRAVLMRYNANGTVDSSFGTGGSVLADLAPLIGGSIGDSTIFYSDILLSNGEMLFSGLSAHTPILALFDANGKLDSSFGTGGVAHDSIGNSQATGMAVDPNGGFYVVVNSFIGAVSLTHWSASGHLDTSFGQSGFIPLNPGSVGGAGGGVAIQPDGSLVVTVSYLTGNSAPQGGWSISTLTPSGQVLFTSQENLGTYGSGGAILLQADGRAVVAGGSATFPIPLPPGPLLVRYRTMADPGPGVRVEGSILTVLGDGSANSVNVTTDGSNYSVTLDGSTSLYPVSTISRIDMRLLGGDDSVISGLGIPLGVVDLGDGNDTASIAGNTLYTIDAGTGTDTITMPAVFGTVGNTIVDGDAGDLLQLAGTSGSDLFQMSQTTVDSPGRHLTLNGLGHVSYDAGGGNDSISINKAGGPEATVQCGDGNDTIAITGGGSPTAPDYIYGGPGDDSVTATAVANTAVVYEADAGINSVSITGTSGNDAFTIGNAGISTSTGYSFNFMDPSNVSSLQLDGAAGNDTFTMTRSVPSIPTVVIGGLGADQYLATSVPLASSSNVVFQSGGQTGDAASLADVATTYHAYTIGGGVIQYDGAPTFAYTGLRSLTFRSGDGGSTILVTDANGMSSLAVTGGAGDDLIQVLPGTGGLAMLAGAQISLNGGPGGANVFAIVPDPTAAFSVTGGPGSNDRLQLDFSNAAGARLTSTGAGSGRYTFYTRMLIDFTGIESLNDLAAPAAPGLGFNPGPPQSISFSFSQDVGGTLTASDLMLVNVTTNELVFTKNITLSYDSVTHRGTFTFSGFTAGILPDGNYVATLPAGSVAAGGVPLTADFVQQFFVLAGDVNRDRHVTTLDFNVIATNFGAVGRTFLQGDLDGDGKVGLLDFNILASRFGKSLAALPLGTITPGAPPQVAAVADPVVPIPVEIVAKEAAPQAIPPSPGAGANPVPAPPLTDSMPSSAPPTTPAPVPTPDHKPINTTAPSPVHHIVLNGRHTSTHTRTRIRS